MLTVSSDITIPESEFEFSASRSSGPGGQNVNKVNSKVTLRWCVVESESLPAEVKGRFLERYAGQLTKRGEVVISSDTSREQGRNRAECLAKLAQMLEAVAVAPKERLETKPSSGSVERRIQDKKAVGGKKTLRKPPAIDDD